MRSSRFLDDYPVCGLGLVRGSARQDLTCIIDTGSPYTIVPPRFIRALDLGASDGFTMVTIHGVVHKEECSIEIPGFEIDCVIDELVFLTSTIFCYEFHSDYGLLGHNILRQCRLQIDWLTRDILIEKVDPNLFR